MPVHVRKMWIMKHNESVERENNNNDESTGSAYALNAYARMEQEKNENIGKIRNF